MFEPELKECIKCAVPHRCSKKCIFCETNFAFIASEPTLTQCGHQSIEKQNIKNEIDLKIDKVKVEIEQIRDSLHVEVDDYFNRFNA